METKLTGKSKIESQQKGLERERVRETKREASLL